MSTELGFYDRIQDPIDAASKLGEWIAKSGLFGCEKMEQGVIFALECMAQRKSPMQLMQTYHVIDSKLAKRADAMLADFNRGGGIHKWIKSDATIAAMELTWKAVERQQISYAIEDAVKAGLCGPNGSRRAGQNRDGGWQKNPDAMLRARCVSKALRMVAPEFVQGVYTEEEIQDFGDYPAGPDLKLATAKVIEVEAKPVQPAIPQVAPAAAATEQKPVAPPAPSPSAAPKSAQKSQPATTASPDQTQTLEKLLKGKEDLANKWLMTNKWLKPGATFKDLTSEQCSRILAKPDAFVRAVEGKK